MLDSLIISCGNDLCSNVAALLHDFHHSLILCILDHWQSTNLWGQVPVQAYSCSENHSWVPNLLGKRLTITGRTHYFSSIEYGQKVFFKREPDNVNDPNVIVVCTYERVTIGHLTRTDAAFYSRFLNFDTCVFGVLTETAHGIFNTSMVIESPKYALFNQWVFLKIYCIGKFIQSAQYPRNACHGMFENIQFIWVYIKCKQNGTFKTGAK